MDRALPDAFVPGQNIDPFLLGIIGENGAVNFEERAPPKIKVDGTLIRSQEAARPRGSYPGVVRAY